MNQPMTDMRAVVVDPSASGRLALQEVAMPRPAPSQALVRVAAISLTPYEIKAVASAEAGTRPGWEFASTVAHAAADGSGTREGARMVADGTLRTSIGVQAPWTEIAGAGQELLERRFTGKAVLDVGEASKTDVQ